MTPDLLPGERWCRSCQRPESEAPMHNKRRFMCVDCHRAADALRFYWRREWRKAGARQSTQARTQVREVAAD